jgi:hypothetical protein
MTALLLIPPTRRILLEQLERSEMAADAKLLLAKLLDVTVRIGDELIAVGRSVVSFVFETLRLFPHIALGVIVGFVLSWLIASAAVVGAVLGPLLGPLLIAFGIGAGAVMDVQDGGLRARVERFAEAFNRPNER